MEKFEIKVNINPKKVYIALYKSEEGGYYTGFIHIPNKGRDKLDYPFKEFDIDDDFKVDYEYPNAEHEDFKSHRNSLVTYMTENEGEFDFWELNSQKEARLFLQSQRIMQELIN